VIVSFPNFGHWRMRLQLLLVNGRMPVTQNLPVTWYDTPNIHFCTIRDFVDLCDAIDVKMERGVAFGPSGGRVRFDAPWWFWNLFGEQAVFLLAKKRNKLRARKRLPLTERCRIHSRPGARAVRHDEQKFSAGREHAPDFTQHVGRMRRHLERMHREHAVDHRIA
jgi:hypothetical protein